MNLLTKIDKIHFRVRSNKWLIRFTIFTRIALAAGFLPSGMQKVLGERFTVLVPEHPMGHYLDAVYQTGFYYTSIGVMQVMAAILLLIPRTATLGVIIYFPIILNICILSLAVRFDGSMITSPLMVQACIYLILWDYHKFKFLLPGRNLPEKSQLPTKDQLTNQFPIKTFGLIAFMGLAVVLHTQLYELKPRNTLGACEADCQQSDYPNACLDFCHCIHQEGLSLEHCLDSYDQAK